MGSIVPQGFVAEKPGKHAIDRLYWHKRSVVLVTKNVAVTVPDEHLCNKVATSLKEFLEKNGGSFAAGQMAFFYEHCPLARVGMSGGLRAFVRKYPNVFKWVTCSRRTGDGHVALVSVQATDKLNAPKPLETERNNGTLRSWIQTSLSQDMATHNRNGTKRMKYVERHVGACSSLPQGGVEFHITVPGCNELDDIQISLTSQQLRCEYKMHAFSVRCPQKVKVANAEIKFKRASHILVIKLPH